MAEQQVESINVDESENEDKVVTDEGPVEEVKTDLTGFLEYALEFMALFDFVTDMIITARLIRSPFTGWASVTVVAIAAPMLASMIQLMEFLLELLVRRDTKVPNIKLFTIAYVSILPIFLVFMFFMDVWFVVLTMFAPFIWLLGCCLSQNLNSSISSFINDSYDYIFSMKKHEVAGFRRMRTITQLTFEGLIQLFVQIQILLYFYPNPEDAGDVGVKAYEVILSITIAFVHLFLQVFQVLLETWACETNFLTYWVVCVTGRFGWAPYIDTMQTENIRKTKRTFNYDKIEYQNKKYPRWIRA